MSMRMLAVFLGAIGTLLAVGLVGKPAAAQNQAPAGDPIVIGHYASMTGLTATFGVSADEGARLAVDEINARGGVLGRPVKLVTEDTQSKTEETGTAVQKLINQDRVVALIGEIASSRSIVGGQIAQRARVPMLSPGSTNPKVTEVGSYVFRACFIDPFQGTAMANFAMKSEKGPKAKRFAILYDVKNDYSLGLREFFVAAVKDAGGEIVADESYAEGDIDFKAQLTKLKATNPDAIWIPGYYTDVGLIAKQARELGINAVLLGGDGWDSDKTAEIGREAIDGAYFSNHYASDDESPEVRRFIDSYKAKYGGKLPDAMAILGYDAMLVMTDAISRAGSTDRRAIRDALAATKDFPGASGRLTMDKNRNAEKSLVVLKIESKVVDGKVQQAFRYVTTVNP